MEEDIFYVELLNGPGTEDSSSKHRVNSGRFYNRAEGLVVVDSAALSETPKDPTGLIAIKGPVSIELVCEGPLAGDNVGALRALYSSSIAARQWGSTSAARAEEGIGDGVSEEVAAVRTRRSGTILKPVLPRVII
jgi:hypothetical protein